jgi:hypothetical protein
VRASCVPLSKAARFLTYGTEKGRFFTQRISDGKRAHHIW